MGLHLINQITVLDASDGIAVTRDVLIDGDRFVVVAPHIDATALRLDERTDGRGKLMIPGLINAHHHSHDRFDKGRFSPLPLEVWMSLYNPPTHNRGWTAEDVYLRTLLNGAEMLQGGITTVIDDIHFGRPLQPELIDAAFRAYETLGIRADVGVAWCDRPFQEAIPYLDEVLPNGFLPQNEAARFSAEDVLDLWRSLARQWAGRVRFVVSASAPHRCTERFLTKAWELAGAIDRPVHVHLLETRIQALTAQRFYGRSMVEFMRDAGVLTRGTVLAHGIWVSEEDLDAVAVAGATIVHNPACNMKLGSGIAPVAAMLSRGINVALGTDNNNGNDSNSMFDAMRLASLSGSIVSNAGSTIDAACCLRMATQGGSAALGLPGTGSIKAGELADFCVLNAGSPAFTPLNDPVTQLVFCEQGRSVSDVYVSGKRLVEQGRITSIDVPELLREIAVRMPVMLAKIRAGASYAERLRPYLEAAFERCSAEPEVAAWRGTFNFIDGQRRPASHRNNGFP
jgi:5-methylthioadenosine/S-adenosylhomocysteine deaminase